MKKTIMALICAVLLLSLFLPASADDGELLKALHAGKTIALVPVTLPKPEAERYGDPIAVSQDGQTMLWRSRILTRDGQEIPLHAQAERGAGDPYGSLDRQIFVTMQGAHYPGEEGVAWSPDGKYIVLTNKSAIEHMTKSINGLMLLDTQNGGIFNALAFDPGSVISDDFGIVFEAQFDASGRYIYFLAWINAFSRDCALYRYSMEDGSTELLLDQLGYPGLGRSLYEQKDGSWLLMLSSDSGSRTTRDRYIRYSPVEGMTWTEERAFLLDALQGRGTAYSPQTGYGLIYCVSSVSSAYGNSEFSPRYAALLSQTLNRITPEGIDLTHYWQLSWDKSGEPGVLSSVRIGEADQSVVSALTALAADETGVTQEQLDVLSQAYEERMFRMFTLTEPPEITAMCQSPDGSLALLSVKSRGESGFFLLDLRTMELWQLEAPADLQPVYYGTDLNSLFRPGMEWHNGDLLLINNRKYQAFRLEVR